MKRLLPHSFSLCLLISTPCANLKRLEEVVSCLDGATFSRCATAHFRYGMDREERGQDSLTLLISPGSTGTLQRRQGFTQRPFWAGEPRSQRFRIGATSVSIRWTGTVGEKENRLELPELFLAKRKGPSLKWHLQTEAYFLPESASSQVEASSLMVPHQE